MDWHVTPDRFDEPSHFRRLKALGFQSYDGLHRFMHALDHAVRLTGYKLPSMVPVLQAVTPPLDGPELSVAGLKTVARAWMDDLHDYCTITHHADGLQRDRTTFNRDVRAFRSNHEWLREAFGEEDVLRYREPADGTILFGAYRVHPETGDSVLFAGNMEGASTAVTPTNFIPEAAGHDWQPALLSPDTAPDPAADAPVDLPNGRGIVFTAPA